MKLLSLSRALLIKLLPSGEESLMKWIKLDLTISYSTLFAIYVFESNSMNLDFSFGASLASVLSISESNLISLISIQLFLVTHIISNRVGIVTKNS